MAVADELVPAPVRAPTARRALIGLLGLAIFINYIDRGNLATSAPFIEHDLGLNALDIGFLTSAFFMTYVPGNLVAGWFVDRVGGYAALGAGFALWSLATALTGLAGGFAMLLVLRVLLGLAESVAFPGMGKLLAEAVPIKDLGVANGVTMMGTAIGPAFGTLAGGFIIAMTGWRAMFIIFGAAALLWLVPWYFISRKPPKPVHQASVQVSPPSYRALLRQRTLWLLTLCHFCLTYGGYFVLGWLPLWLIQQHGYSVIGMAKLGAAALCVAGLTTLISGWVCDGLIARGHSHSRVRKTASAAGQLIAAVGLAGCALAQGDMLVVALLFATVGLGLSTAALFPITQTISGPQAAGRWISVQNCIANTAGIVGPIVTGWIVDSTGSFNAAFLLTAAIVLTGAFGWAVLLPRVEPINWAPA